MRCCSSSLSCALKRASSACKQYIIKLQQCEHGTVSVYSWDQTGCAWFPELLLQFLQLCPEAGLLSLQAIFDMRGPLLFSQPATSLRIWKSMQLNATADHSTAC
jgi:hypothetical protein